MDFKWFPASTASRKGGSNATSTASARNQSMVVALKGGDINVLDFRVPTLTGRGIANDSDPIRIVKSQVKAGGSGNRVAGSTGRFSASSSSAAIPSSSNPPCSLQLTSCGRRAYILTELGTFECWDLRATRAALDRVTVLDSWMQRSQPQWEARWGKLASATDGGEEDGEIIGDTYAKTWPSFLGLDVHRRGALSRICSATLHPEDDNLLTFQLLNGGVGLLDLNPPTSERMCVPLMPADTTNFMSGDPYAMRPRRTHTFLPNGGPTGSAARNRERTVALADQDNRVQIIGQKLKTRMARDMDAAEMKCLISKPFLMIVTSLASRVVFRHCLLFPFQPPNPESCFDVAPRTAVSPSLPHSAFSTPSFTPPRGYRLLTRLDPDGSQHGNDHAAASPPYPDSAHSYSSFPLLSLTAHPSVPYLIMGSKHQQLKVATHASELEGNDHDGEEGEAGDEEEGP